MKKTLSIALLFFLLGAQTSFSQKGEDLNTIVNKIQSKYEKIENFYSEFTQEAEVNALNTVQKATGEVWFKKPGKMRWNYQKPSKDTIVSDGSKLWFYNEQENQVIESTLEEISGETTSTTLLSGLGKIKDLFNVKFYEDNNLAESNSYLLELTPKKESENESYNNIIINVDKNTSLVNKIYLFDPFGNQTKIILENLETNKKISDKIFNYKPPKGVEVVKIPSTR